MFGFIKKIFKGKESTETKVEQPKEESLSQPVEIKEEISQVKEESLAQPVEIKEEISQVKEEPLSQPVEIKEEISQVKEESLSQPVEIKEEISQVKEESLAQLVEIKEEISQVKEESLSQPVEIKEEILQVKEESLSQPVEIKEEILQVKKEISTEEKSSQVIDSKEIIVEKIEQEIKTLHDKNVMNDVQSSIIKSIQDNQINAELSYEEKQEKIDEIQHHLKEEVESLINQQLHHEKSSSGDSKSDSEFQTKEISEQFESLIAEQLEQLKQVEAERTIETEYGKIILPLPFAELEIQSVILPQGYVVEFTEDEIEEELNKYVFGQVQDELGDDSETSSLETAEKPKLEEVEKLGWFARLRQGLQRTRELLSKRLSALFSLNRKIDDDLYDELETILLTSDVGIEACSYLMTELQKRVNEEKLETGDQLKVVLKDLLYELLLPLEQEITIEQMDEHKPYIIMMVGVNGAGKTTTIGKLAKYFQSHGKSVLLAAGDTFRAAAREQLMVWGERNNVTVVAQDKGDPAAVVFDAIASAKAKNIDIVLADTAGRLATQAHLMKEIEKVKRVIQKAEPNGPHEILLVIDSNTGQNGLMQVKQFDDALGLTGLILTKLDGTAKGGIIAAIAKNRPKPVRFIGVGEGIDDLRPFTSKEFVDAMFD